MLLFSNDLKPGVAVIIGSPERSKSVHKQISTEKLNVAQVRGRGETKTVAQQIG